MFADSKQHFVALMIRKYSMKICTGIWLDNNIYHIPHALHRVFENHDMKCHYPVMKMS